MLGAAVCRKEQRKGELRVKKKWCLGESNEALLFLAHWSFCIRELFVGNGRVGECSMKGDNAQEKKAQWATEGKKSTKREAEPVIILLQGIRSACCLLYRVTPSNCFVVKKKWCESFERDALYILPTSVDMCVTVSLQMLIFAYVRVSFFGRSGCCFYFVLWHPLRKNMPFEIRVCCVVVAVVVDIICRRLWSKKRFRRRLCKATK